MDWFLSNFVYQQGTWWPIVVTNLEMFNPNVSENNIAKTFKIFIYT